MHKVKNETGSEVFPPNFQKPARAYPTNFSKLNYIKPTTQLSRSKYRISVEVQPFCRNKFLTDGEKEIKNLPLF